mgnify:CR=1 FL=1
MVHGQVACSAIGCSIVLISSSYIAVTGGIIEARVLLSRDAGADNYPARRRARRGAIWVWLWVCGFDCCGIFDSFSLLYCMLGIQLIVLSLQNEDEDSDEGGAGHLLTAWLGELDTLKKVNREEAE